MTRFFVWLYRYFKAHSTVFYIVLVASFALLGFFASRIHLEEDINKLMPSSRNPDGTTKLAFADLRIKDKTFLLFEAKKKMPPEKISETADAFIDSLLKDNGSDTARQVISNIFYKIDYDLLPNAVEYMESHFPAFIDTSAYAGFDTLLTKDHMMRQMQQNAEDFNGEFGSEFPEAIETDPIGMRGVLLRQLAPLKGASGSYITVNSHFFVKDTTVLVAFLTPKFSATNTGEGSRLFKMIDKRISEFSAAHPDISISYHGTPASGYYNAKTIKRDLWATVACSLVLVVLFICLCFRRASTVLLLVLPVAFGTLLGLAAMYFIKGQFSLLALGIGAVVLGVAMSYVLHVLTHNLYVDGAEQVLRDETRPVLLGCVTTIGSFMGLVFINTDLLKDFGLFAAFAIVGTTFFSLAFLPQFLPTNAKPEGRVFKLIDRINNYRFDRNKPLIAVIITVTAVCVAFYIAKGTDFDADMNNLGYRAPETSRSDALLKAKTFSGDKTKYFAASGKTMEEALANFSVLDKTLDSLQRAGLVKSYTHTDMLFVPVNVQHQRIEAWQHYWTPERLAKARALINSTAPAAGLDPEGFEAFFDAATASYEPDKLYEAGIMPAGLQSTLMERTYGGDYLCFTSVRCANDSVRSTESDYYKICKSVASKPNLLVLDTYYYTTDSLMSLNKDFNVLQWVSMLFVLVVLAFSFRFSIKDTLLGFAPILLSWLIVLGAMGMCGMKFNLINIIISTFIFGIGVDYSIFVMSGLKSGSKSPMLAWHKTAIFFSAVILVVTVSSMLFARHPAIRSVGFSTLVGLLSALILSYVLQPAVYRWLHNVHDDGK